ncbi:MAG: hypothetical protein HGA47_11760, partial [Zoogloea sp.]|nr:hypothetical protein [Zoogloea sp.]
MSDNDSPRRTLTVRKDAAQTSDAGRIAKPARPGIGTGRRSKPASMPQPAGSAAPERAPRPFGERAAEP